MTEFETSVISRLSDLGERLARIEENAKSSIQLTAIVTLQGARIDELEKRVDRAKNRLWGVILLGGLILPQLVSYLRVQIFGAFFK